MQATIGRATASLAAGLFPFRSITPINNHAETHSVTVTGSLRFITLRSFVTSFHAATVRLVTFTPRVSASARRKAALKQGSRTKRAHISGTHSCASVNTLRSHPFRSSISACFQ
ncbi:hypothetical protein [Chlorobium phaeobacteroides]|uniref:hypothetical protein n=1 Tax=Chlorobium phaeobacteroides TaxID=1096 RepID=UPI0012320C01|nr:hypothetical protein [Chlorobium phaeobacteroides]